MGDWHTGKNYAINMPLAKKLAKQSQGQLEIRHTMNRSLKKNWRICSKKSWMINLCRRDMCPKTESMLCHQRHKEVRYTILDVCMKLEDMLICVGNSQRQSTSTRRRRRGGRVTETASRDGHVILPLLFYDVDPRLFNVI